MARVEIYLTRICPYCAAALQLLRAKGVEFREIDIMTAPHLRQEMMERSGGRRTVPQIFINEEHIGGCDDLYALDQAGRLDGLLAQGETP